MAAAKYSRRRIALVLADIALVLVAFDLSLRLRMGLSLARPQSARHLALIAALVVGYLASFYIFDFYNIRANFRSRRFAISMAGAFGLAYLLAIVSFYIFPYQLGRGVFLISWALTGLFVCGSRLLYSAVADLSAPRRNVLILGGGSSLESVVPALKDDPEFRLEAIMDKRVLRDRFAGGPGHVGKGTLEEFVADHGINDIVVSLDADDTGEIERALVNCRMKGIACYTIEAFYERVFEKLPVLMLNDRWFVLSGGFGTLGNRFYKGLKRAFDVVGAGLILLVTLPVSILVALAIRLTSRGPVFFTQLRLGEGKVPFRIVKFRTMVHDAEADGPQWARDRDKRVTAVGRFLRRTRLDEIPQFINVLKGEMSLIGPRPEREYFVNTLTERIPFYSLRFFVKPGLTGWAQINYHYGLNEEDALEKLRYELFYIKNQSLALDLRILLRTVRVVLTGQGT